MAWFQVFALRKKKKKINLKVTRILFGWKIQNLKSVAIQVLKVRYYLFVGSSRCRRSGRLQSL